MRSCAFQTRPRLLATLTQPLPLTLTGQAQTAWESWYVHPESAGGFKWPDSGRTKPWTSTSLRGDLVPPYPSGLRKLYVATEPDPKARPKYFGELCSRFECLFSDALNQTVLEGYHRMFEERKGMTSKETARAFPLPPPPPH